MLAFYMLSGLNSLAMFCLAAFCLPVLVPQAPAVKRLARGLSVAAVLALVVARPYPVIECNWWLWIFCD